MSAHLKKQSPFPDFTGKGRLSPRGAVMLECAVALGQWCGAPRAGAYGGTRSGGACLLAQAARVYIISNCVLHGEYC